MKPLFEIRRVPHVLFVLLTLVLLQGCFWESDDPAPTPDANPTGYYKQGTLTNSAGTVIDSAFQAIVYNGHLMMMSVANGLLYDGNMVITGNSFTTTAVAYTNGVKEASVAITGNINAGSEITGDITSGGSFTLTYAQSNSQTAAVSNVMQVWTSNIGGSTGLIGDQFEIDIASNGDMVDQNTTRNGNFDGCSIFAANKGKVTSIDGTNLFLVSAPISSCTGSLGNDGNYTGLATSEDPYATLVFMMTIGDSSYGMSGNFTAVP